MPEVADVTTSTVDAPVVDAPVVESTTTEEVPVSQEIAATVDGEVPAEPQEQPVVEDDPFADVKPDGIEEKRHWYTLSKSARLMAADKLNQGIQAILPGANLDTVKSHIEKSVASQNLIDDWYSGDPQRVGQAATFLLDKAPPGTVATVAEQVLDALPQVAPQAYEKLTGMITGNMVDSLYLRAMQTNDENLFKAIQNVELATKGRYRTLEDFQQQRDPRQAEFETMAQKLARYEQAEQQQRQQQYQSFAQQVEQSVEQAKISEIEKSVPQAVADAYKGKPEWDQLMLLLQNEVNNELKGNSIFSRELRIETQRAKDRPSEQTRAIPEAKMRQFTQAVMGRRAKAIINRFAQNTVNANAKLHSQQAKLQDRRESTGTPSPSSPNGSSWIQQEKVKGTSFNEMLDKWASR